MSFVVHSVERWDEILNPNPTNDSALNGNYEPNLMTVFLEGRLGGIDLGRVTNYLSSTFLDCCDHAFEGGPLEEAAGAGGFKIYLEGNGPGTWKLDLGEADEDDDDYVTPVYGPESPVIVYRFRQPLG